MKQRPNAMDTESAIWTSGYTDALSDILELADVAIEGQAAREKLLRLVEFLREHE